MEIHIRPALQTWPSVERDRQEKSWADVPNATPAMVAWEKETELAIPADYRGFMHAYNGGRIYPNLLRHPIPNERYPATEPVTILDPLYRWDYVEQIWRGEVFRAATPRGMLTIGSDPGSLEVLLSVTPETYGRVFGWLRVRAAWGTDDNNTLYPLAPSFMALLEGLFDNAEREGHACWHLPGLAHLVRKLELV